MPSIDRLYEVADELRATANVGLRYSKNEYDTDRYRKILDASARLTASLEDRAEEEVLREFQDNTNYVCPAIGAGAILLQDGKMLLIKRHDVGLWAYPGGAVETEETLAEAAERELREETGVEGRATRLIGMFDSRIWKSRVKRQMVHAVFLVEAESPEPRPSTEALEVGFFGPDNLPPLDQGHHVRVPRIFELLSSDPGFSFFDGHQQ